ncbi:hypothetical protein S7711_11424 [Stachybotrys chartarum IBT 7711]|uniref:Uncharacterized protein n=1 Tax=Stachybotrys chartarum (strain CBS 109288 / IBT 7711) TaxID=1280523 RepID=A0A084B811_STACB|nr:hypothetical protein S7711_11424 [Stachybotrys chartarum IBT 7711]
MATTSPNDDASSCLIAPCNEHWAAVQMTFSHRSLPDIPQTFQVCRYIARPCCDKCPTEYIQGYIDKHISGILQPGTWLKGQFHLARAQKPKKRPRREEAHAPSTTLSDGNGTPRQSRFSEINNAIEAKDIEVKDKMIAANIAKKLVRGIAAVWDEDKQSPGRGQTTHDLQAVRIESLKKTENIRQLGTNLWLHSHKVEETTADVVHQIRLLSSYCRLYLKKRGMSIDIDPDPSKQETQKRHDEAVAVLSWIIDGLHQHRSSLALVLYRAVCKMRYVLNDVTRVSSTRRRRIAELVALALRHEPIVVAEESRVIHPGVFLKYNSSNLQLSDICGYLELSNLGNLSMTDSQVVEYAWGVPIGLLLTNAAQSHLPIFVDEKFGLKFISDCKVNLPEAETQSEQSQASQDQVRCAQRVADPPEKGIPSPPATSRSYLSGGTPTPPLELASRVPLHLDASTPQRSVLPTSNEDGPSPHDVLDAMSPYRFALPVGGDNGLFEPATSSYSDNSNIGLSNESFPDQYLTGQENVELARAIETEGAEACLRGFDRQDPDTSSHGLQSHIANIQRSPADASLFAVDVSLTGDHELQKNTMDGNASGIGHINVDAMSVSFLDYIQLFDFDSSVTPQ